ncbi:RHS repeat protein [Pseudoteredinibacter isoporae]|uniref:YD repeat-containing protein n=1 Tax=Pseudoteredinibacter isoporae TaxID=570281 RepID=A0A7X0MX72_9GAMM|nr:RHS repeat protein [Pseudoteredinibacter isoporae]MBB6521749.1 YD repeat-containing protein [Pseudoteredinibacter isoporae]NHO87297.1 RHS repeat protein [Pseudoteredinibacter isoporae]NIB23071.1 RHS repeat protein [Pseudoteredinibacter isoporae]
MERVLTGILLATLVALCPQLSQSNPIPDYYSAPGKSQDRSEAVTQMERIDPFSGSLNLSYVDIHLPGSNGFDININRIYRSLAGDPNLIGQPYLKGARKVTGLGWDIHMGRVWTHNNKPITGATCRTNNVSFEKSPVLELADGSRISLVDAKPGIDHYDLIGRNNWIARCRSNGGLEVYDSKGTKYTYSLWGLVGITDFQQDNQFAYLVTRIEDTYGNRININYTSRITNYKVIESVTANDGRRVTFNYKKLNSSKTLLKSISAHGRTVKYQYKSVPSGNGKVFLSQAVPPQGRSWKYQYKTSAGAGRYSISGVTSPTSLKSEYTFGAVAFDGSTFEKTTVVTRKKLSWGNKSADWTYSYSPAGTGRPVLGSFPSNMEQDVTTIVGPYYCQKYTHIGNQAITKSTLSGVSPYIYLVGTLTEKVQYRDRNCSHVLQRDLYDWAEIEISEQNNVQRRGLKVQEEYSFPVLRQRETTLNGDLYRETYSNFDVYGNPQRIDSRGSKSKITYLSYKNDLQRWIVGLPLENRISNIPGSTKNTYTSQGNLSRSDAYGVITQYHYDGRGNLSSQTDPAGRITRYSNYSAGQPEKTTYPDSSTVKLSVNRFGEVESFTDQLNRTTGYSYDHLGRLTYINTPRSNDSNIKISYSYPRSGIRRTLKRGRFKEQKTFDAQGSLTNQTSEGISLSYSYDLLGRKVQDYLPNSKSLFSRTEYDALGRTTKMTHADGSSQRFEYNSNYSVKHTDENNRIRYQHFDVFGNPSEKALKQFEIPGGQLLKITRNNLLQPISYQYVTYTGSKTRNLSYNNKRFLIKETHPDYGDVSYTHYNDGQVKTKQTGFQPAINYTYDSFGRLQSINYPEDTPDESYQYDLYGNMTEVTKGDSIRRYEYDLGNNLSKETLLIQGGNSFVAQYEYNAIDALNYLTYPSGRRINLKPDDLGRPRSVSGFVSRIEYFPNGMLKRVNYGNGRKQIFTQSAQRLWPDTQIIAGVMSFDYAFDPKGNMKSMSSITGPYPDLVMQYDSNDQLISTARGSTTESFAYDYAHNITSNNRGTQNLSLAYSSADWRLSSVNKDGVISDVNYDDYGHTTSIGVERRYSFGHDGHLKTYNNHTKYAYDGAGNRFLKTDPDRRREFFYSRSGLLLAEYDPIAQGGLEHIYLQKKRIASLIQCASDLDSDGDGESDCKEQLRTQPPAPAPDNSDTGDDNNGGDNSGGDNSGDDGSDDGDNSGDNGDSGGDGTGEDDGSVDNIPDGNCTDYDPNDTLSNDIIDPNEQWQCRRTLPADAAYFVFSELCIDPTQNIYRLEHYDMRPPGSPERPPEPVPVVDDSWYCNDIVPIQNEFRHQLCISGREDAYAIQVTRVAGGCSGGTDDGTGPDDDNGGGGTGNGGSGGNGDNGEDDCPDTGICVGDGGGGTGGPVDECPATAICVGGGGNGPVIIQARRNNSGKKGD